ncbi:hypothetical protein [Natronospira bacteriovora]|uniref:LysB family phage lysis regulatory protein n=1 Tax=Natronospira bacteriovora TaxID=3069753 RepID=A0ABU0W5J6_9GAMM|nr:hypothetical protein [Natronospira sp. AB-CW4]MDQ2069303.1 hypothetical protein [Natronospira sp. AB-CW4]
MIQKKALIATGTALLMLASALAWTLHALGNAREESGRLESELAQAVAANESNQLTIDELEQAVSGLRSRRLAEQARADAMDLELQQQRQATAERVQTLQDEMDRDRETDDAYRDWADRPLPDTVADRLRRAGGRNGDPDS